MSKHRKHRSSKAVDPHCHCRNHGECPTCQGNRQYQQRKADADAEDQVKQHFFGVDMATSAHLTEEAIMRHMTYSDGKLSTCIKYVPLHEFGAKRNG